VSTDAIPPDGATSTSERPTRAPSTYKRPPSTLWDADDVRLPLIHSLPLRPFDEGLCDRWKDTCLMGTLATDCINYANSVIFGGR
ncbi:hypothetical protein PRIPAC_77021, partial [Pristionchus pacificus]|uniref:Uncharacterized protein n=1 Tax=Pristionchus pacificus TaxID=54126 RepID=A0A2A6C481_PRIPA